jgi:hypothetical protein
MRSKTFQRILNKMEKNPWWVKLKIWLVVELHVINCLGIVKYVKLKIVRWRKG